YDGVRVLNMPCEKHDAKVDLDLVLETDLPEGALYIKCDKLEVLDRKVEGQPSKEMKAIRKVLVLGREFWARAEEAHYNQAKQQVILDGKDGVATLNRVDPQSGAATRVTGRKIIYNRATGEYRVTDVDGLHGETVPQPAKKK